MGLVKFFAGTLEEYKLSTKSPDGLYFITDTFQLYKGTDLYTKNYAVVANLPPIASGVEGILYVTRDTKQFYIFAEGDYLALTPAIDATVTSGSTNLITSGGVYTAIAAVIATADALATTVDGMDDRIADLEAEIGTGGSGDGSVSQRLTDVETDVATLKTDVDTVEASVASLNTNALLKTGGTMTGSLTLKGAPAADNEASNKKYVDDTVSASIAAVTDGAPAAFDTLKEIADWIASDVTGTTALVARVAAVETDKVDKVDGMGLSHNDLTDELLTKLNTVDTAGEENVIEVIKVNGAAITVDGSKAVNITVGTGVTSGTISVNGTEVAIAGLGSAAYEQISAFATAAQGAKADSALQAASIATGTLNGTIAVAGTDIAVKGLGTAAYKAEADFIAASTLGNLGSESTITAYADAVANTAETNANTTLATALTWSAIS